MRSSLHPHASEALSVRQLMGHGNSVSEIPTPQAIGNLKVKPDLLLNDAVTIPEVVIPQVPIIKGDAKSVSIAAASIVAKVTRDRLMEEYDKVLPGYGFASNKGYGSAEHIKALQTLGSTPIHRRSFIGHFV